MPFSGDGGTRLPPSRHRRSFIVFVVKTFIVRSTLLHFYVHKTIQLTASIISHDCNFILVERRLPAGPPAPQQLAATILLPASVSDNPRRP